MTRQSVSKGKHRLPSEARTEQRRPMARQDWNRGFTNPNGTFVTSKDGIKSFVPNPLPPEWDIASIHKAYVRAEKAVSSLGAVMGVISVPDLLTALYIRREAVQSSRIEGTLASLDDLLQYEAGKHIGAEEKTRLSITEVSNCARAMEDAMDTIEGGDGITIDLIKSAHRKLLHNVVSQERNPGSIRTVQNAIVVERGEESDVVYVPPPPEMVGNMLDALVRFMGNTHPEIPVIIQCAMAHYQFEAIHPFGDGNGRVGRMLIPLVLAKNNTLSQPLLQLGEYMAYNRREYYGCLERVSQKSEWNSWLALFMRALAEQAEATIKTIVALTNIRIRYIEITSGSKRSVAKRIVEMLFANPYITTRRVKENLGVSQTGAVRGISRLVKAGILRRVPVRHRTRVWVAHEIIGAIQTGDYGQYDTRAAIP